MTAHKLQGRMKLYGFEISIENAKGSVRRWYDPHGKEKGHTKMHFDYGYIRGTKGTDGDHVDVYVGENPESDKVYVIDQMKKPEDDRDGPWKAFDEQKCMLAFPSAAEAKFAYLKQYDDPRFFGGMKEMSVEDFKAKVLHKDNHGKKVANGDMIQYFMDHPQKHKEYLERKKKAALMTELNMARLSAGEPIFTKVSEIFSDAASGVTVMPPVTAYGQTTSSKRERRKADDEMKVSAISTSRAGRIGDRIDDAGIAMLAAPYVGDVAGHALSKSSNPKLKALGAGVESVSKKMHASHAREIGGLALVAPGVTHTIARGIDKVLPGQKQAKDNTFKAVQIEMERKGFGGCDADDMAERVIVRRDKLEKIASQYFEDFEYKTETEKTAIIGMLGRMAGTAVRGGRAASGAVQAAGHGVASAVGGAAGRASSGLTAAVQRAGDVAKGGFIAGERGVSQAVGERASRMARTPGSAISKVPVVAPPSSVARGGIPTPVPTTTAARGGPGARRALMLGGGAAVGTALGAGAYGGYKGIQAASTMLQTQHEVPLAAPGFVGTGRTV